MAGLTPLQKRLSGLREMATVSLLRSTWPSEHPTRRMVEALLALLPVVEAAYRYHHVNCEWGRVVKALDECERALTETKR